MTKMSIHDFPDRAFKPIGVGDLPSTPVPIARGEEPDDNEPDQIKLDPKANDTIILHHEDGDPKQPGDLYNEVLNKMARISKDSKQPILFNGVPCLLNGKEMEPIKAKTFNPIMANMINFYEINKDNIVPIAKIPDHVVTACYNHQDFGSVFPTVSRVTSAPLFMDDGTILSGAGYVPELNIYQLPGIELTLFDDLEKALEVLQKPFKDFEFKDEVSRANTWAYFFTILMQPFIRDNVPFFNFTGTTPGTGKGMLCRTLHRIVEGCDPETIRCPDSKALNFDDALDRKLNSALLGGAPVYRIDNVRTGSTIDSDLLAIIATEDNVKVKVLYETTEKSVSVSSMFVFTGNNIFVSDDLRRRTQHIILQTDDPKPETREFDIDLKSYVLDNRQELLSAALSILNEWHKAGRPKCEQIKGSFQSWVSIIGGIIEFAGLGNFQANETNEEDIDPHLHFVERVYNTYKSEVWRVSQVIDIAIGDDEYDATLIVPQYIRKVDIWLGGKLRGILNRPYTVMDYETGEKLNVKIIKTDRIQSRYFISVDSAASTEMVDEIPF